MKKLLLAHIAFLLLFFGTVSAQVVNIENRRIYDDTAGWSGAIDGGFSAVQNAELLYSYNLRPRAQYKTRKHYYLLLGDITYTRGAEETYANSGMTHFRYAYRIKNSGWKWESYAQVQYNQLLDQKLRSLLGTGIRVKFLDRNGFRLFAGTSSFYEYEELQTENTTNTGFRWSNYLSWFFNPKGKSWYFTGVTYYQPLFSNFRDYRFSGQYTFGVNVFKRVDLKMEYTLYYDSRPPSDVRNLVYTASTGVHVKLGE
jgi:hypothetical protein